MSLIPSTPSGTTVGGASTLSGNTLGGNTVYYCCNCRYGPQLVSLYPSCINCEHHSCIHCETGATDNISDREIAPTTLVAETIVRAGADAFSDVNATFPRSAPVVSAMLQLTPAVRGPFSSKDQPTDEGVDWYCCSCGDGPHSVAILDGCSNCDHWKCSGCSVEPRK